MIKYADELFILLLLVESVMTACDDGHFEFGADNACLPCPTNCRSCDNSIKCNICNDGYYKHENHFQNSQRVSCSKCSISYCRECNIKNGSLVCTECNEGYKFNGKICIVANNNCSEGCLGECHANGVCSTCIDGWTGNTCSESCAIHCVKCSKENSNICLRCNDDFYTASCNATSKDEGLKSPSTTVSLISTNQSTSTSGNGKMEDSVQGDTDNLIIGSGAGGGVVLLLVALLVIFCLVKRRSKTNNGKDLEGKMTDISDNMANRHIHSKKPDSVTESETQEYIYAKPNKPRKSTTRSEQDNVEHQEMNENIKIGLNIEHMIADETNIDSIELEDLEEGAASSAELEVKIPTADIYYNTESLIRSRIRVSNLLDYIKNKTDYQEEFEKLPKGLTRTCNEALRPINRLKNRYNGLYAYDATRVVMQSKNFVNASYIDGHDESPAYIASLGPTKVTMDNFATFWEMIWQENVDKIIMLTNLEEGEKMKCEQYWPEQHNSTMYGDYKVACTAEKVFSEFIVRDLTVARESNTLKVTQFHYTAWPDKTVPNSVASLLEFRDKVEQTQSNKTGPIMVHCSAGIGRTGTYIAMDILTREAKEEESVDIFGCVNALRGQRVQMVQNVEQYVFLHHCILYALTCDPDTQNVTAIPHLMTDERISLQYQAFVNFLLLANGDKTKKAMNKGSKEKRKGADIPVEGHRVRLTLTKHEYVNAVYLNGHQKSDKFIAAQTPLPTTLEEFVSMLYQERCPCVVCLDEENMKDKSVAKYLPPANKTSTFGHYQVACMKCDQKPDFVIRQLKLSRIGAPTSEELEILHYQFKGWNSSELIPSHIKSFLNMILDVEKAAQRLNCEQPIAVHCCTGAERSGLFCAVSILLEKVAVDKELSVLNTICQVCSRRRSAFREIEQFRFCYSCVEEMIEMSDTNTYYNIRNL